MEIIHLILGKANPDRMNGVNRVVHEMATNQVMNGYDVQVWGITDFPDHDYPPRAFTTLLFRSCRNPFRFDPSLGKSFLERKGHIVVHIHGAFIPVFYSVAKFLHKHHIPFILTPHSTYNKVMMKKNALRKKIYFRFFEKRMLDRAAGIHLLGLSEWEGLEAIYHNRKSFILPYGFTRRPVTMLPDKAQGFLISYCGRMAIYPKGLDILIEGFALFNRLHPEARLILVGDGKEKGDLLALCRELGCSTSVIFQGSLFGEEKTRILQTSHVFAHPSRTDGLPATIVEAASLGLPCIVSDATNMGDFVQGHDAGYRMKSLDKEELCAGLCRIYERINGLGEEDLLQHHALEMIDKEFNWKTILEQFDKLYRRVRTASMAAA